MSGPPIRRRGPRGAVLVETALTVGVILTILLFSVQAGLLGFLQITYDAASFVDARLAAVDVATPGAHANATHAIFSQVAPAQIVSTVAPAPSPSVPVDYGYNSTNTAKQAASISNRHGGASMMLPTQQTSTITKPAFFTLFGKKVGVASQSVEALWLECGIHVNVSNGNGGCSPAAVGAGSSAYAGSYFTAGEDAPPYFVGLNHIHHCLDAQPWTTCSSGNFLALGSSEFLHGPAIWQVGNWANAGAGAGGIQSDTTFAVMACHQRTYATIAATLANPAYATLNGYYDQQNIYAAVYQPGFGYVTNGQAVFYQMYNFDGNGIDFDPTSSSRRGMNSFQNGPPGLLGVSIPVIDWDLGTDNNVGRVYGWDTQVAYGAAVGSVGSNSTNPDTNCQYYP